MSFNLQPNNLENNLVKLRPLISYDYEGLFAVASDPLIWAMHPMKDRYKREVFQAFFDKAVESGGSFVIIDLSSGAIIGSTRFYDFQEDPSQIAIGYSFLARQYWGGDYNKSVKALMLNYAFQYIDKIIFHVGLDNLRSQKALEKIGAERTKIVDFDYYGKKVPHYEFEITKNKFQH